MATIKTSIMVQDSMSPAIRSMSNACRILVNNFEDMRNASSNTVDVQSLKMARDELNNTDMILNQIEQQTRNVNQESRKMPSNFENANGSANSLYQTLMRISIVQKGISLVSNQVESAIKRLDTMNNYPKVMSNLGIATEQSKTSIQLLSNGLKGLPTALDSAAAAVQRFTASNNSIGYSTKMFLAINNALLAGGQSTDIQTTALEQLSQAYSKGKPDMMEWKSLQAAMPAQLQQIAKAMNMTEVQLGESLRNGKVSINDFMDTIIQLNETGANGFQSFAEQAKNATGGMATSIANMKTSVTRGITEMITKINNALESASLPNIQTMLMDFGSTMESMLENIGNYTSMIISLLSPVLNFIQMIYNFVVDNWTIIEPILQGIIIVLGIYYTYMLLAKIGTDLLTKGMIALSNPMTWIMIGIIAIVAILIYFWNTSDKVAYGILFAWDMLRLGALALKIGAQEAFYGIVIAGLYMYQGILGVKMGLQTAFYMIQLGALSLKLGFQGVCQGIVNAFIWMYNEVVGLLNKLGASFDTLNYVNFTDKTVNAISDTMAEYTNAIAETYGEMEDINSKINEYQQKLVDVAVNGANQFQSKASEYDSTRDDRVANRRKLDGTLVNSIHSGSNDILSALNDTVSNGLNNITGNTKDIADNTSDISEEDLRYLIDIAERETINRFTTAEVKIEMNNNNMINGEQDIDGIVEELATRLEEELQYVADGIHM